MCVPDSLKQQLAGFKNDFNLLPEADEPPSTTLQIIRSRQQEQDWQRLLFHYLSPDNPHGLDYALLEHLLSALSERSDLDFTFSQFDLADIQVEQEVTISNRRRPDAVIWASEDWFICWELKVGASEDEDQTRDYVDAEVFSSINIKKEMFSFDGHYYIYLAPDGASPEANEFVPISWEWVGEQIQTFLAESQGEYPARTIAQLETFTGTIQSKLQMTDYQENQQEKVELYVKHYNEISEVEQVFDEQWEQFRGTWGTRLVEALDTAVMVDNPDIPDGKVTADITMKDGSEKKCVLSQDSDWGAIRPLNWRTELDETEKEPRVYFFHRVGNKYKSVAVGDRELKFRLQSPRYNSPDDFYENFSPKFESDEQIPDLIPARSTRTGNKANVLEATYDINVDSHSNFFEAYIAALSLAMDEHVISNPELINRIDELYSETLEETKPF
jgi:hypothetical protein